MNNINEVNSDRGQVGIGTLIVFIAMVLVAAIAAGVLIDTAGMLQSQAEATGEESTERVSERINAHSAVGIVGEESEDLHIEEIRVAVTAAPGATEINLDETIIQVTGPGGHMNLDYADDDQNGDIFVDEGEDYDIDDLGEGEFVAVDVEGDVSNPDEVVLNHDNGEYQLIFNAEEEPFADESGELFHAGEDATLDIISPSSAVTTVELSAPDLLHTDGEAVRL